MKREPVVVVLLDRQPARLEDGVEASVWYSAQRIAIVVASSSSASSTPQLASSASRAASSK